jgi:rhodanese-related sulfurtransferase
MKPFLSAICFACLLVGAAASAEDDIGISTEQAFSLVQDQPQAVLFIDVRDPVEIMFTGFTNLVDRNIPFLLVDRTRWDEEKGVFQMDHNPKFVAQVDAALEQKGLDRTATIVTMCRSGSGRGMPSAAYLRENGFPNATYVIHGFQGDRVEEGPQKGRRVKNGWVNDGLPWSTKADPEKLYRPQAERANHGS